MENNTTIIDDCLDCISESSSMLDDIEIILVAGGALLGIAVWGYKKYKELKADGKITLDEILDVLDDVEDKIEEAEEQIEVLTDAYDKYKVTELRVMLKEKGLSTKGNKAELIARLEE
tara:strand:- start:74 stop:427 length:354 start_codon:yes stop_codon:yes gene_type:complete